MPSPPWLTPVLQGIRQGLVRGALVLMIVLPGITLLRQADPSASTRHTPVSQAAVSTPPVQPQSATRGRAERAAQAAALRQALAEAGASASVRRMAAWAVATDDPGRRPFAVVDKSAARMFVFDTDGRLAGTSPILLGLAAGDHSVPGIGRRPIAQVRPEERTTPAGRFVAEPGRNAMGERVVWVDYDAAVSMHRVRLAQPAERRLQRLASNSPRARRISYGCINVPDGFFDRVAWPMLGGGRSVFYVLPERLPLLSVFPAVAVPRLEEALTPTT